ncbi:KHNYN [Pelobates cultripes]|uniref:NEDD4-binding protein 1 n=2 Tax=Pelobates cultripes TaxID=61616 RepID=A0AAD1SAW1_PELCU|nr:KHNYN [Pelobates cultripes]
MPGSMREHAAGEDTRRSVDEFAVPEGCERELRDQQPHVERLFGVTLNIVGVLSQAAFPLQAGGCQQMWLQLQGDERNVKKAKDYIKGLCTPEIIEDINYPRDMYCIFVGAKGIFLDCLIRATSACVKSLTPGRIRISGLIEGVVMGQSRVHAFFESYPSNSTPEDKEAQFKRNFKDLVEEYSDNYALDLLILPTSVKQQLLDLVHEDSLNGILQKKVTEVKPQHGYYDTQSNIVEEFDPFYNAQFHKPQKSEHGPKSYNTARTEAKPKCVLHQRACEPRPYVEVNDKWDLSKQETNPNGMFTKKKTTIEMTEDFGDYPENKKFDESEIIGSDNEEFEQISGLLDTIMGRDEGDQMSQGSFSLDTQEEFNMLLDFFKTMGYQEAIVLKVLSENGIQEPSKILDKVKLEQCISSQMKEMPDTQPLQLNTSSSNDEDNYLLGVVKSAAKNCGYSPSEIVDIGDGSVAGLLRKLNEKNIFDDDRSSSPVQRPVNLEPKQLFEGVSSVQPRTNPNISQPEMVMSDLLAQKTVLENHPVEDLFPGVVHQDVGERDGAKKMPSKEEQSVPVVTGAQRFNETIQNPFQLNLRNEKGNDQLRHIIIDGSNVAMIHGLRCFFSCRGIALAVQFFWDRGHRNITVFVPHWRLKKDNKIKEQHFLTELNEVGLLSFTPSRQIEGKKICSYDDRFMVKLAEKTDGVIVTNDNLRDIYAESDAWKNIIKDRLLQYTFVGDIFMVPDDPLGRSGPPLDTFLCKTTRQKGKSKGHSFAGRRISRSPPKKSSQTEVLNYRDRKPPHGHRVEKETDIRPRKEKERLRHELLQIFPSQHAKVDFVLHREPYLNDLNKLSELIVTLEF